MGAGSHEDRTDDEVVDSCRRGEPGAFEALVRRHQDAVYGMALRFARNRADAEEIAQEVFLRVFRGIGRFRGGAKLSTWIYRITANACTDWHRANRRRRAVGSLDVQREAGNVPDTRVDIERSVVADDERARFESALDSLDARYRMTVELVHRQGLSYEQASEALGISPRAVETRLYRARAELRRRLGVEG